jgi:hypothetical protein
MADIREVMIIFELGHQETLIAASTGLTVYTVNRPYPNASAFRALMPRLGDLYTEGVMRAQVATGMPPDEWEEVKGEATRHFGGLELVRFSPEGNAHLNW